MTGNDVAWIPFSQPVWGRMRVEHNDTSELIVLAFLAWRLTDEGVEYLSSNGYPHRSKKIFLKQPDELK